MVTSSGLYLIRFSTLIMENVIKTIKVLAAISFFQGKE
jgi:hypothetical protein